MALIDDVKQICDRLANAGWRDLMLKHDIDISQSSAQKLADALDAEVDIDRSVSGFEDFIKDKGRGIEAGDVAASLLYHAFASPGVQSVPDPNEETPIGSLNRLITDFPTVEELNTIENYIFAKANRSLDDVRNLAAKLLDISNDSVELAVAVFASEYRPAPETPHQRYADLCLSRTGVARVGTARAVYDDQLRGYVPFRDGDTVHTIRVLPCLYVTWLAVRSKAKGNRFGPAREQPEDAKLDFWAPVHKLFDGDECLKGKNIQIELEARHQNRKIERLHKRLKSSGFPSGFSTNDLQKPPFIKEHGLVDWLDKFRGGTGLLGPQPQPLVERSSFKNTHLTFKSPPMSPLNFSDAFSPTLTLNAPPVPVRPWPEYAHVRFDVTSGNATYFGDQANVVNKANKGRYRALNISDSTADGWIKATVSGIESLESIPAYSLVAAPDFFPSVDQREVFEWWKNMQDTTISSTQPDWLQKLIQSSYWYFWRAAPDPLSDQRYAPNIELTNSGFDQNDNTVTSIVVPLQRIDLCKRKPAAPTTKRHAALPDAAAGVMAPGWDTSADKKNGLIFLSAYGLGSPFPEDAKLCAALSTFWPAVAPDTARTFFQVEFATGTVCPLTDEENGAVPGSVSWDGLRGPHVLSEDETETRVRYSGYEYADYTLNALENRFSIAQTYKIDFREYTNRILATLRMYSAFGLKGDQKNSLHILSFRRVESIDATLKEAQDQTNTTLRGPVYRFDVFSDDDNVISLNSSRIGEEDFSVKLIHTLFVGTSDFLLRMARRGNGSRSRTPWKQINA